MTRTPPEQGFSDPQDATSAEQSDPIALPAHIAESGALDRLVDTARDYAGRLRRSELVGLDHGKDDTPDWGGWIEILDDGALLALDAKTGWREVEIGRGSSDQPCPVHAREQ